jgi:hypothetical protein
MLPAIHSCRRMDMADPEDTNDRNVRIVKIADAVIVSTRLNREPGK